MSSAEGRTAFYSKRDSNCEIYVINTDGTGQTMFTNNAKGDFAPA